MTEKDPLALFVLTCLDKPGALALRMANRETHLAYVHSRMDMVKAAGPLLDDSGDMCGSHLILEAADRAAIEAFTAADPYAVAGLFQSVEIRPWRVGFGGFA